MHTPEFAFERDPRNVMKAVQQLKVEYPVALDNQYSIWRAFNNRYWPAQYFIDAQGNIRGHQFGEGNYARSEQVIDLRCGRMQVDALNTDAYRGFAGFYEEALETGSALLYYPDPLA